MVWLEAHPYRTREWLARHLADGFDIHHIDGDHENNDPKNLILIEHGDHLSIHNGGTVVPGRLNARRPGRTTSARKKRALERYEADRAALSATYGVK